MTAQHQAGGLVEVAALEPHDLVTLETGSVIHKDDVTRHASRILLYDHKNSSWSARGFAICASLAPSSGFFFGGEGGWHCGFVFQGSAIASLAYACFLMSPALLASRANDAPFGMSHTCVTYNDQIPAFDH